MSAHAVVFRTVFMFLVLSGLLLAFTEAAETEKTNVDLNGKWDSTIGLVYSIKQAGREFTWNVEGRDEIGKGQIIRNSLRASWKDANGRTVTASGRLERNEKGDVVRIRWSNGVEFTKRQVAEAEPKVPVKIGVLGLADLNGKWDSNVGLVYDIRQQDKEFSWNVESTGEKGAGTISGDALRASWKDANGRTVTASARLERNEQGDVIRIRWSNGVEFTKRQVAEAEPKVPVKIGVLDITDLNGKWKSNIGLVYEIEQKEKEFAWYVASNDERGRGHITGNTVRVSWKTREGSTGSATGEFVRDDRGSVQQIKMSNGVVLIREDTGMAKHVGKEGEELRRPSLDKVPLTSVTWSNQTAKQIVQSRAVRDSEDFVQHMETAQSIRELSDQTGISRKRLLFLAHELELRGALLGNAPSRSDWMLLKELGLETIGSLVRFSGNEDMLHELISNLARHKNVEPPTLQQVRAWVQQAEECFSSIPPLEVALAGDLRWASRVKVIEMDLPGKNIGKLLPHLGALLPEAFVIAKGQTEFRREFFVNEPGLYCATIQFDRKGGIVEMAWAIDRPKLMLQKGAALAASKKMEVVFPPAQSQASLKVTGYEPLIKGKQLLAMVQTNHACFYISPEMLPLNRRLYLRLKVLKNEDKIFVGDDISGGPGPTGDPTIRGTTIVSHVPPIKAGSFDTQVALPQGPENKFPLYVVSSPLFEIKTEKLHVPRSLWLCIAHDPDKFGADFAGKPNTDIIKVYPANTKPVTLSWGLRDGKPVQGIATYHEKYVEYPEEPNIKHLVPFRGVDVCKIEEPKFGVYSFLVNTNAKRGQKPSFQELKSDGFVYSGWIASDKQSDVRLFVTGGEKPKTVYVVELERLEMSGQAEYDDDNDDGVYGEFEINVSSSLTMKEGDTKYSGVSWAHRYPDYPDWLLPGVFHIKDVLDAKTKAKKVFCYPKMPVASFSEEKARDAYNFGTVVSVIENDEHTWWQKYGIVFELLFKAAEIMLDIVDGNWVGLAQDLYSFVDDASSYKLDDVDEFMGRPAVLVPGSSNWGLRNDTYFCFPAWASSKVKNTTVHEYPTGASPGGARGVVTARTGAAPSSFSYISPEHYCGIDVSIRKRLAPFSWSKVEMKEFTVRQWRDKPEEIDLLVRKGPFADPEKRRVVTGKKYTFPVGVPPAPKVPEDLRENAYTYIQWEFSEDLPGCNEPLGIISFALYHEDFYRAIVLKEEPYADDKYGPGLKGVVEARYYKEGEFLVGEFTIKDPGTWMEEVKLVAYVYVYMQD